MNWAASLSRAHGLSWLQQRDAHRGFTGHEQRFKRITIL